MKFFIIPLSLFLLSHIIYALPPDLKKNIFRITASGHPKRKGSVVLTGFVIKGHKGIITSLHGVLGFKKIVVSSLDKSFDDDVRIVQISVAHDLALLASDKMIRDLPSGFDKGNSEELRAGDPLVAIGFPGGILGSWEDNQLTVEDLIFSQFRLVVPPNSSEAASERKSPALNTPILRITGTLMPGNSGSPILDEGNLVVGVGCGGDKGHVSWAIKIEDLAKMTPYEETDEVKRIRDLISDDLFAIVISARAEAVKISRLSIGCKIDHLVENKRGSAESPSQDVIASVFLLGHPSIFANRVGGGIAYYFTRKYTSYNTFTTLKDYVGVTPVEYSFKRAKLFGRIYLNGPFDSWKLFNAYAGASVNMISQVPSQEIRENIQDSEVFIERRKSFTIYPFDYFVGVRFAKKWYSLDLEVGYMQYELKSENFQFNFFGNATPIPRQDTLDNFNVSIAAHLNLAMIK